MKKFAVVVNDGRNSNAGYGEDLYEYNSLEEDYEDSIYEGYIKELEVK